MVDGPVQFYTILTTLLPSTTPFKLFAWTLPSTAFRARSSSHHPNKKSRAISLNHGVKAFSGDNSVRGVANGFPGLKALTGILEHSLKFPLAHVLVIPDLVQVRGDIDVSSEEQNVVNWFRISAQHRWEGCISSILSCSPHLPSEGAR